MEQANIDITDMTDNDTDSQLFLIQLYISRIGGYQQILIKY